MLRGQKDTRVAFDDGEKRRGSADKLWIKF